MEYKNLPELTGLATLRAVIEHGGTMEAAKILHVGQPAVTKRLRALEESYGIALLERIGGRLRLTQAGEKVYLFAVQTLDRQLAISAEFANLAKGKNTLRLEVTVGIGEHLLPDLLVAFTEQYPDFLIQSRLAYSRQIQTDLATGRADMALVETAPDHPDILVQKWQADELWLVCGLNHPLWGQTDLLPVEELRNFKFILREADSSIRESLDSAIKGIGIEKLHTVMEVGSSEAIIDILNRGKHLSFLPRFAVFERVNEGSLFHIKVKGFRILRTLWIARNRDALDHPVAEAFINMIREMPVVEIL